MDWVIKNALRTIISKLFIGIPLPDKEELVSQVSEVINKYGIMRAATIGEVSHALFMHVTEQQEHAPEQEEKGDSGGN